MLKNINLIDENKSDIEYKRYKFNDGEDHIIFLTNLNHRDTINVITRISSAEDLFILTQVADILNRHGMIFSLDIKYLMGARMDRVMTFDEPYTLKIVANIINSLGAKEVKICEPHSQKSLELIHNSISYNNVLKFLRNYFSATINVIFPDEGAALRYEKLVREYEDHSRFMVANVTFCNKKRNTNGGIDSFEIKNPEVIDPTAPTIIIDDLCDTGHTLCLTADTVRKYLSDTSDIYIYVTHAVNINGLDLLQKHCNYVYVTNSYKNYELTNPKWKHTYILDCNTLRLIPNKIE